MSASDESKDDTQHLIERVRAITAEAEQLTQRVRELADWLEGTVETTKGTIQ